MSVGERVFNGIVGNGNPTPGFVLLVARADLVEVGLADIVQERDNRNAFVAVGKPVDLLHARTCQNVAQTVVHIQTVLQKSALVRAVIAGGGGSGKEIRSRAEVVEQFVSALAVNFFLIDRKETFCVIHFEPLLHRIPFYFTTTAAESK